jgi:hypothetical protein
MKYLNKQERHTFVLPFHEYISKKCQMPHIIVYNQNIDIKSFTIYFSCDPFFYLSTKAFGNTIQRRELKHKLSTHFLEWYSRVL